MSARRFSVTLSEDDLRPHMRKPKPKKSAPPPPASLPKPQAVSEILELERKHEAREKVKQEVRRRIEEEEKEKERRKKDEEIRRETQELLAIRDVVSRGGGSGNNQNEQFFPKLGRRVNNFQYFRWDSDEELPVIPAERVPSRLRTAYSPAPSSSSTCELCTLALRSVDRSGGPTKSAACAHVDAFVATSSSHSYH